MLDKSEAPEMTLQEWFDKYVSRRYHRIAAKRYNDSILKPLQEAISAVKKVLIGGFNTAKLFEQEARDELEEAARNAKLNGEFSDPARHQLDGGYVEVQGNKQVAEITGLRAFLESELGRKLVAEVVLKKNAASTIKTIGAIPGIKIRTVPGAFKVSVAKEEKSSE